jgi:hypothetical protein
MTVSRRAVLLVAVWLVPCLAGATVEMQNDAKKLGFAVHNCLYCHASPHAIETMQAKAKAAGMSEGNCLACHGANIPAALNQRGEFLVTEKGRRNAKGWDMAWLKDYKEPTAATKPATAKPAATKPETIQLAPKP